LIAYVVLAEQAIAEGASQSRIALELGLTQPTLSRWLTDEHESAQRPVEVESGLPSGLESPSLRLRTPRGFVVEGLDLESVAALLRVLG
jgi:transposase-like protein